MNTKGGVRIKDDWEVEYKVLDFSIVSASPAEEEEKLNELAAERWRVISVDRGRVYLQRYFTGPGALRTFPKRKK